MVSTITIEPNPHAVDQLSIDTVVEEHENGIGERWTRTIILPRFKPHNGWLMLTGRAVCDYTDADGNTKEVGRHFDPPADGVAYTVDELRSRCFDEVNSPTIWGPVSNVTKEIILYFQHSGTGRVIVSNGKVVIHDGKVVIDW